MIKNISPATNLLGFTFLVLGLYFILDKRTKKKLSPFFTVSRYIIEVWFLILVASNDGSPPIEPHLPKSSLSEASCLLEPTSYQTKSDQLSIDLQDVVSVDTDYLTQTRLKFRDSYEKIRFQNWVVEFELEISQSELEIPPLRLSKPKPSKKPKKKKTRIRTFTELVQEERAKQKESAQSKLIISLNILQSQIRSSESLSWFEKQEFLTSLSEIYESISSLFDFDS